MEEVSKEVFLDEDTLCWVLKNNGTGGERSDGKEKTVLEVGLCEQRQGGGLCRDLQTSSASITTAVKSSWNALEVWTV